jgi:hypothetical protein
MGTGQLFKTVSYKHALNGWYQKETYGKTRAMNRRGTRDETAVGTKKKLYFLQRSRRVENHP